MKKMNSDDEDRLRKVFLLIENDEFQKALSAISKLDPSLQNRERLLLAKADCLYELNNDLGAIEYYGRCLKQFPAGRSRNFALMGAAVSLKNLDLQDEAADLLRQIDPSHSGIDKELQHSEETLLIQSQAREIIKDFAPSGSGNSGNQ